MVCCRLLIRRCLLPAITTVLALWLVSLGPAVEAMEVEDLYLASVPVASSASADQAAAFQEGLKRVLTKVTGSRTLAGSARAESLVSNAQRYVQQFQYESGEGGLRLTVRFDADALTNAMDTAGLPLWGSVRPVVLSWLVIDDGQSRTVVTAEDPSLSAPVMTVSADRGLPILLPLWDAEDQRQVQIADLVGGLDDTVLAAAQRYEPDGVLAAQLATLPDGVWQGHWRLHWSDQVLRWKSEGKTLADALSEGLHVAVDKVATRLGARRSMGDSQVLVRVSGINSLEDYARVDQFLSRLTDVQDYHVERISAGTAEFALVVRGDPTATAQLIALGDVMAPQATPGSPAANGQAVFEFRLVP